MVDTALEMANNGAMGLTPNLSKPMPSTPFFKIGINFNAPPNVAANPWF